MKTFLQNNDIKMYSTYTERKSFIAEGFVRTLKKIKVINTWLQHQKMCILISYMIKSANKYNNTYHRTVKMKPVDVK